MDWVGSLQLLLPNRDGIALFSEWLSSSPTRRLQEDAMTLDFVLLVSEMQRCVSSPSTITAAC